MSNMLYNKRNPCAMGEVGLGRAFNDTLFWFQQMVWNSLPLAVQQLAMMAKVAGRSVICDAFSV